MEIWAGNKEPMLLEQEIESQKEEINIEEIREERNVNFFEKFI